MRDALLLGFIAICLAAALRRPFIGLLCWGWFSLAAPHQLTYGASALPLNLIIALFTIAGWVISGEVRKFKFDPITAIIIAFAGWLTLSQLFSLDPEHSALFYDRFIKTLLFVALCIQMTTSKARFLALAWLLTLTISFMAAKGAAFTFVTLGEFRVQGLPNTILEDNNHFGIAAATILPLILYLRGETQSAWLRMGLLGLFCLTLVAIIGTHSRGAFLSLLVFGFFFWLQARRKITILAGLFLVLIPTISFMPGKWTERMHTIGEATQDASFMGRVDAWVINWKLALENPITGGGLRTAYQPEIAYKADPIRAESAKAAHSIYFEVLGGAGFIGLGLYLTLWAQALLAARCLQKSILSKDESSWVRRFGLHAQIALLVFAVGGASTSMEMWHGYLAIIALLAAVTKLNDAQEKTAPATFRRNDTPRWRRSAPLGERTTALS